MDVKYAKVGVVVVCNEHLSGIPKGSIGVIDEDYGTGITVAWNVPYGILPRGYKKAGQMRLSYEVIRDGFNKSYDLQLLTPMVSVD